jgi:hypothetical protein
VKPTFLVIGAAKAGTTSLYRLLGQHPQIFLSARKELHFFSFDRNWEKGPGWYESWFEGGADFAQRGEASSTYTVRKVFPLVAERLAVYDPERELRLIYIVRDPLERIESGWQQLRRFGPAPAIRAAGLGDIPDSLWVDSSFDRAVRRQSDALVESTNYREELAVHRRHYPDARILVLLLEDLKRDPRAVMRRCFGFLGVDAGVELTDYDVRANAYGSYSVPRPLLRRFWASPWRRRICAAAVDRLPPGLAERVDRRLFRVRLTERPRWEPETRHWVLDRLRSDLERFLEEHGYPRNAWRLDEPRTSPADRPG